MIFTPKQLNYLASLECLNIELIVMLNEDCNANCRTCILKQNIYNETTCKNCLLYKHKTHSNCYSGNISNTLYEQRLTQFLEAFQSNKKKTNLIITITGGEPTLAEARFTFILDLCEKIKDQISSITIESNGANIQQYMSRLLSLKQIGLPIKILLNRYALDDTKNADTFLFTSYPVYNKDIKMFVENGLDIDIRCILQRNNINTISDLKEFYQYYKSLGIKKISFVTPLLDDDLRSKNSSMYDFVQNTRPDFLQAFCDDLTCLESTDSSIVLACKDNLDIIIVDNKQYNSKTLPTNDANYSSYMLYSNGNFGTTMREERLKHD